MGARIERHVYMENINILVFNVMENKYVIINGHEVDAKIVMEQEDIFTTEYDHKVESVVNHHFVDTVLEDGRVVFVHPKLSVNTIESVFSANNVMVLQFVNMEKCDRCVLIAAEDQSVIILD